MSRDRFGDEGRKLTPRSSDERLLDQVVYYGLGQVFVTCGPVVWLVFQSPRNRVDLVTGVSLALVALVAGIGLRRATDRRIGGEWRRIDDATLGIGDGYARVLTRGVLLSSTVALASFGAAGIGGLTPLIAPVVLWPVVTVTAVVLALPALERRTPRRAGVRLAFASLAFGVVWLVGAPLDLSTGFTSAAVVYPMLVGAALLDGWMGVRAVLTPGQRESPGR